MRTQSVMDVLDRNGHAIEYESERYIISAPSGTTDSQKRQVMNHANQVDKKLQYRLKLKDKLLKKQKNKNEN